MVASLLEHGVNSSILLGILLGSHHAKKRNSVMNRLLAQMHPYVLTRVRWAWHTGSDATGRIFSAKP